MTFEETMATLLDAKLAPVRAEVGKLTAEIKAIRRALPPALVTFTAAAEALGVSVSTIRRRVRDGSLPVRRVGHAVRVDLSALNAPEDPEVIELADALRLR